MLKIVVVMLKRAAGVIGWVNKDALHFSCIVGTQSFQRIEVVALNQHIGGITVAPDRKLSGLIIYDNNPLQPPSSSRRYVQSAAAHLERMNEPYR